MLTKEAFEFFKVLINEIGTEIEFEHIHEKLTLRLDTISRTITFEWDDADDEDFHKLARYLEGRYVGESGRG